MGIATDLLKAERVGIRELKKKLSASFLKKPLIITDRKTPVSVNLPYSDMLELIDILDELSDVETLNIVKEGRKAIYSGAKGISVSDVFEKRKKK